MNNFKDPTSKISFEIESNGIKNYQDVNIFVQSKEDFDEFTETLLEICRKIFYTYVGELASKSNLDELEKDITKYIVKFTLVTIFKNLTRQQIHDYFFEKFAEDIRQYDALNINDNLYFNPHTCSVKIDPRYIIYLILNPEKNYIP